MVRTIFTAALLLLCSAFSAAAATVTLTWDPNPESDVTGYVVFYGTAPGQYGTSIDAGNQTSLQLALPDTTTPYFFAVCAYNAAGLRSALSTEVSTTNALVVTSLTSNVPAPQSAGTPITLTAAVSGGAAQFKWWVFDGTAWA